MAKNIPAQTVSKNLLVGFRDALTAAAQGDHELALANLEDMVDDENLEDTLDGLETLSSLVVAASDEDEDLDDEDEDLDDEDEDLDDEDEDEDDEDLDDEDEDEVVESRLKTKRKTTASLKAGRRKSHYLSLALASLDEIEDEEDDEELAASPGAPGHSGTGKGPKRNPNGSAKRAPAPKPMGGSAARQTHTSSVAKKKRLL